MIAPGMPPERRASLRRQARGSPATYARWPGIAGCATKMLIGRPCASDSKKLHPADASRAAGVLRERFAFVGLLEHWNASVCVFHALMMRGSQPDVAELQVTHATPLIHASPPRRGGGDAFGSSDGSSASKPRQGAPSSSRGASSGGHVASASGVGAAGRYDVHALHGFVDALDEVVYAAARERFWQDARRTGCASA